MLESRKWLAQGLRENRSFLELCIEQLVVILYMIGLLQLVGH